MGRPPCCDKLNVKRGPWTAEEDAKILAYVANHGIGNWTLVPQKAGLNRCGKSCRLRWTNYLRPDLKHDNFTTEEEELILKLHEVIGSRWSLIAKRLPGRTDNDVKNYWNTKLKKKLTKMGIDPVTHKPFSQILTDYGNISSLPSNNARNQIQIGCHANLSPPQSSSFINQSQLKCSPNNHHSLDDAASCFPLINHFFSEVASSSSSPSCSSVTQFCSSSRSFSSQPPQVQVAQPSSPSSWNEFILGETLQSTETGQERKNEFQPMLSPSHSSISVHNETPQFTNSNHGNFIGVNDEKNSKSNEQIAEGQAKSCSERTSAAESFVDAILHQYNQIELEFPELLDGYYDY